MVGSPASPAAPFYGQLLAEQLDVPPRTGAYPGRSGGVKGVSLFTVPRHREGEDGKPEGPGLGGLNHKVGYRVATSTLLRSGEGGETVGELVGQPGRDLAYTDLPTPSSRAGPANTARRR
ncbi:hypothetical protein [Deinococcus hopiensis]|uniref:hypothetical protein n=1 Tax=Deinococcus hopiensis TaxID=309885 RepID=UPI00111C1023|nr:hypothetical protein [Deinococcus hopiensis]